MAADRTGAENDYFHQLIPYRLAAMHSVLFGSFRQAAIAAALAAYLCSGPAAALNLFTQHQVTVEFSTAEGKPLADAEVRVFAPGRPGTPVLTGRTDKAGKFEFPANEDGLWSAEARTGDEIGRVTIRVGGAGQKQEPLSPVWMIGGLFLLLVLGFAYRIMRARSRRGGS